MAKRGGAIDLSALNVQRSPRTAREVAEKKMRDALRAAGDAGASKKTGGERDDDLAEFYRKRKEEKLAAEKLAKQKLLLADPTQSLIDCACGGAKRLDDLNFLIGRGCDLDDMINDMTPLMYACKYGGALHLAQGGAAAAASERRGGGGSGQNEQASGPVSTQVGVEALVRGGADVDLGNSVGVTALMFAVSSNNSGAVSFLIDHSGARPEVRDHSGHSALQCAYERGLTALASKIVRALAQPPPKVTTIAKEKLAEAKAKAAAEKKKEKAEKQAARDKMVQDALAAAKA